MFVREESVQSQHQKTCGDAETNTLLELWACHRNSLQLQAGQPAVHAPPTSFDCSPASGLERRMRAAPPGAWLPAGTAQGPESRPQTQGPVG